MAAYFVYTSFHSAIQTECLQGKVVVKTQHLYDAYEITQKELPWSRVEQTYQQMFSTSPFSCPQTVLPLFIDSVYVLMFMICRHSDVIGASIHIVDRVYHILGGLLSCTEISHWIIETEISILEKSKVSRYCNTSQHDFLPYLAEWFASLWSPTHQDDKDRNTFSRHVHFFHHFMFRSLQEQNECFESLIAQRRNKNAEELLRMEEADKEREQFRMERRRAARHKRRNKWKEKNLQKVEHTKQCTWSPPTCIGQKHISLYCSCGVTTVLVC